MAAIVSGKAAWDIYQQGSAVFARSSVGFFARSRESAIPPPHRYGRADDKGFPRDRLAVRGHLAAPPMSDINPDLQLPFHLKSWACLRGRNVRCEGHARFAAQHD
jgi:hypothetical protein